MHLRPLTFFPGEARITAKRKGLWEIWWLNLQLSLGSQSVTFSKFLSPPGPRHFPWNCMAVAPAHFLDTAFFWNLHWLWGAGWAELGPPMPEMPCDLKAWLPVWRHCAARLQEPWETRERPSQHLQRCRVFTHPELTGASSAICPQWKHTSQSENEQKQEQMGNMSVD